MYSPEAPGFQSKKEGPADPTRSSRVVTEDEHLTPGSANDYGRRTFSDKEGGVFHEIDKEPERQMAVSMLLKGFVNVASVVNLNEKIDYPGQTNIASYEAPNFEPDSSQSEIDLRASLRLLSCLFGDYDHSESGHNVKLYEETSEPVSVIYDFEQADFWWCDDSVIERWLNTSSQEELVLIEQKVAALEAHYSENEGFSQMQAIEKKVQTPLWKLFPNKVRSQYSIEDFYAEFMRRLQFIQARTQELLKGEEYKKAA